MGEENNVRVSTRRGGARGAFHIGSVKALLENGYQFDGVVGTSIGAFNGALISQGDFDKAYELWMNIEPSVLFDIEDEYMKSLTRGEMTKDTIKYLSNKAKNLISNKGIDTSKLNMMLKKTINEEKLRNSTIDFGLVTVSISDFKAVEIYKEDIPYGMIIDYIMASANFPGFKLYPIDGKYYLDGGIYDNCPVNLLIKKGYNDIIAIRTTNSDKFSNLEINDVNILNIVPSEDLGRALIFDNNSIKNNIELGYYDTLRVIHNLKGRKYYIDLKDEHLFYKIINNIPKEVIFQLGETLNVPKMNPKRMLFEQIIPIIANLLNLTNEDSYENILIGLLEVLAKKRNIEKFKIYTIYEFIEEIEKSSPNEVIEIRKRRHLDNLKNLTQQYVGYPMLDEIANVILDYISKDTSII